MTDAIAHRGPDGAGVWTDPDGCISLGHRRLAIIDLSPAGAQPMASTSGRYEITYNGEIYNYQALRAAVQAARPATVWIGHSDTEVLLECIDLWGLEETLRKADGMFALALWDRRERRLHLARDRFGEKPLYYGFFDGAFVFGSELTALRAAAHLGEGDVDPDSVTDLLQFSYIPAPHTIYRSVRKLPPASHFSLAADDVSAARWPVPLRYWDSVSVALEAARTPFEGDDDALVDRLQSLLMQAVSSRLIADVPVGAMLSGGVDSTVISAMAQQHLSSALRTFTVGFENESYDETSVAGEVAARLGTDHTTLQVSDGDALENVPTLSSVYSEPFADSSQLPTLMVSRALRSQVTVALSGDAGDELFAGYNRYRFGPRIWDRISGVPLGLRRSVARLVKANDDASVTALTRLFGVQGESAGRWRKAASILDATSSDDVYDRLVRNWSGAPSLSLQGGAGRSSGLDAGGELEHLDAARRMMLRDTNSYLPDDILTKVDRASMAVGLECRPPFLTPDLYAFAWSLPIGRLIGRNGGKLPLRQLAARFVPGDIMDRPKQGFAIPLDNWLRGPLRDWADDLLSETALARGGYLDVAAVQGLWRAHRNGSRNSSAQLWPILMLQSWLDQVRSA